MLAIKMGLTIDEFLSKHSARQLEELKMWHIIENTPSEKKKQTPEEMAAMFGVSL